MEYIDNKAPKKVNANGGLITNWNCNKDYGNEYVKAHFRIDSNWYGHSTYPYKGNEEIEFYQEIKSLLEPLGWKLEENIYSDSERWGCGDIKRGKESLYLHPQDFSGEVLKNDVKVIANSLEKGKTFKCNFVDLYETCYEISDEDYQKYLDSKKDEIKGLIFKCSSTNRVNKFYHWYDILGFVTDHTKLCRVGIEEGLYKGKGQTMNYVNKIMEEMIVDGYLIKTEKDECNYIRSLNKTEMKKAKLKELVA